MFQKRQKKKGKRRFKQMESSALFHLDHQEEDLAHQAKRQLELCSHEDHFHYLTQIEQLEDKLPIPKRKVEESIRTTTSCERQNIQLQSSKRALQSRNRLIKPQCLKTQRSSRPLTSKPKIQRMTNVMLGPIASQTKGSFERQIPESTKKFQLEMQRYHERSLSTSNRRIHQNLSIKRSKPLSVNNRYYLPRKNENSFEKKNFFSFNDAIENYDPAKLFSSREIKSTPVSEQQPNLLTPRNQILLRPQFLKLLTKIKQKEEANKSKQKPRTSSGQRKAKASH